MKLRLHFILASAAFLTGVGGGLNPALAAVYDLRNVKGMGAFGGSAEAREILARNGFVVANPAFKQIFEPYIQSPEVKEPAAKDQPEESLPAFITTDSAWHTYHVLLEEGVKEMEEIQSKKLLGFSRRLWTIVKEKSAGNDLVLFASVGLGLQDEPHRQNLTPEQNRILTGLRSGAAPIDVPIGFNLSPLQFRAQSFYQQSSQLSDYFAARQWYATVVFRLANPRETKLAIALAQLISQDLELMNFWKELSEPLDTFLALPEDGTVLQYFEVSQEVVGAKTPIGPLSEAQVARIQTKLQQRLPQPRISDQLLMPSQYAECAKETRGFRLLPPRRLPCAVCFQNTTDPRIPNRAYPSGLDFLAASPVLRSPAAVRALESQFGKSTSEAVLKMDCGSMPNSLHGQAMQLLAALQKPLPATAPASMRGDAWLDLQLWTQLGVWAEQRHTWALHTKLSVSYLGMVSPPRGMVAPYPEFFSGLGALARRTALAFEAAGVEQKFSVPLVASNLLESINLMERVSRITNEKDLDKLAPHSAKMEQLAEFENLYTERHRAELQKDRTPDNYTKIQNQLKDLAKRCAAGGEANKSETDTLRLFYDSRQSMARLLGEFAPVCDRLAELARKTLTGQPLTEEDAKWIENYGVTLARFHFYYGNSYEVPRDDFPIVTRVFSNPRTDSMLYAGLTRPQALYVIASDGKANRLYRGAVLTYREFVRPNDQLLDDQSWRELVSKGQTPPAPPFTSSFYVETSAAELIKVLQAQSMSEDARHSDVEDTLWQLRARVTDKDLPALLNLLVASTNAEDSLTPEIGQIISRLEWGQYEPRITKLLAAADNILANSAAQILLTRPGSLDCKKLITDFSRQPSRTRRLYCVLLSQTPQETGRDFLWQAVHDADAGVRWQAVLGLAATNRHDERAVTVLLERLKDTNQFVAAAAVHSLSRLHATNTAPMLLAELSKQLDRKRMSPEELQVQAAAITTDLEPTSRSVGGRSFGLDSVLDPEHIRLRLELYRSDRQERFKNRAIRRVPPQILAADVEGYTLVDALLEAFGEMKYTPAADALFKLRDTEYEPGANRALRKIAPERLTADLLAKAKNKQLDGYLREQALLTLCHLTLTNCVRDIIPLLDDQTPIVYERPLPGPEWRLCDRAAVTIAVMAGWERPILLRFVTPQKREKLMKRAREWAASNP